MIRVGYHYTTLKNWWSIQQQGLKPSRLSDDKLATLEGLIDPSWDEKAVWVWKERMQGVDHVGSILYQVGRTGETKIVVLKVGYPKQHVLRPMPEVGEKIRLRHTGSIGVLKYHQGILSDLVIDIIPPQKIELLDTYDVLQALDWKPEMRRQVK